jgi:hypothetical protein
VMSGLISFAIAQRGGGHVAKLRQQIAEVLYGSAEHVDGRPPGCDSELAEYRNLVLDLCLPKTAKGIARKVRLQEALTSDIREERIVYYRPGGKPDMWMWVVQLAGDLLPGGVAIFQRRRWMSSTRPLSDTCRLAQVHHVLVRVVPRWLRVLSGNPPEEVIKHVWADGHPDEEEEELRLVAYADGGDNAANGGEKGQFDWAEWNKSQRTLTLRWIQVNPAHLLTVARIMLEPQIRLLGAIETITSRRWAEQQLHNSITCGPHSSRVQDPYDDVGVVYAHCVLVVEHVAIEVAVLESNGNRGSSGSNNG